MHKTKDKVGRRWYGANATFIKDTLHTPMTDELPVIPLICLNTDLEWFKQCDCSRFFYLFA